jgi:hypothetical protein
MIWESNSLHILRRPYKKTALRPLGRMAMVNPSQAPFKVSLWEKHCTWQLPHPSSVLSFISLARVQRREARVSEKGNGKPFLRFKIRQK